MKILLKQFIFSAFVYTLLRLHHKSLIVILIQKIIDTIDQEDDITLKVLAIEKNDRGRFLSFYLQNTNLLGSKLVIRAIFNTLMTNESFLNFGHRKIILTTAIFHGANFR